MILPRSADKQIAGWVYTLVHSDKRLPRVRAKVDVPLDTDRPRTTESGVHFHPRRRCIRRANFNLALSASRETDRNVNSSRSLGPEPTDVTRRSLVGTKRSLKVLLG